jgi:hypothetical protein
MYGRNRAPWDAGWLTELLGQMKGVLDRGGTRPAEVLTTAGLGFAWWRGSRLGLAPATFDRVLHGFKLGIAAYALNLALSGWMREDILVAAGAVPYLALGLLMLALTHQIDALAGRGQSKVSSWLTATAAVTFGLLGIAALVGVIFQRQVLDALLNGGQLLQIVLALTSYPFLIPLGFVAEFLVQTLWQLTHWNILATFEEMAKRTLAMSPEKFADLAASHTDEPSGLSALAGKGLKWLLMAGLTGAGMIGLAFTIVRRTRPDADDKDTERERLDISEHLRPSLTKPGFSRPRRGFQRSRRADLDSVRGLYREMLRSSVRFNTVRAASRTPYEFEPLARGVFPEGLVAQLTEAYVRVRYGEEDVSPEEIATLRRLWHQRWAR